MVENQIEKRGVHTPQILAVMRKVRRHLFVQPEYVNFAYTDRPLPIASNQTISQPYIVALMTELLELTSDSKVLEIGTGCGYQTAVLAELAAEVYSIEILAELAKSAKTRLETLAYQNVHLREGNGYYGWPENAPYDAILVTAAPKKVPEPLIHQLGKGGRLVIPVGDDNQKLVLIQKTAPHSVSLKEGDKQTSISALPSVETTEISAVSFVPMTGAPSETIFQRK